MPTASPHNITRLLVTGDQGFVGQHALKCLPAATGLSSLASHFPASSTSSASTSSAVATAAMETSIDICDKARLIDCLSQFKPDTVLHLAAKSFVPDSFLSPEKTFEVNFLGTLRLLEALAETSFTGRFLYAGTGDAYGLVTPEQLPLREEQALRPRNPYAVSKAAAEALCYQWSQTGPFEVIMARPFNHIGAGQAPSFALSDFARQIAEIAAGRRLPVLQVGNIDVTRDFTDVQDVLHAYELLLTHGHPGEIYNVCSGIERSVRAMLEQLLHISGVKADIITDPARYRPADQARVCGSHAKLTQHTGWQPSILLDQTLSNLYHYWEKQIGN